jgi:hypothetical protein
VRRGVAAAWWAGSCARAHRRSRAVGADAAGEIPGGDLERRRDLVVAVVLGMNLALQAGDDDAAHRAIAEAGRAQVAAWRAS